MFPKCLTAVPREASSPSSVTTVQLVRHTSATTGKVVHLTDFWSHVKPKCLHSGALHGQSCIKLNTKNTEAGTLLW